MELVGGKLPENYQGETVPSPPGKSLTGVFKNDDLSLHEQLWWCHDNHRAIRVGDWKLVAAKDDPWELYDMKRDRGEETNLAAEHPDKVRELEQRWLAVAAEFEKTSE